MMWSAETNFAVDTLWTLLLKQNMVFWRAYYRSIKFSSFILPFTAQAVYQVFSLLMIIVVDTEFSIAQTEIIGTEKRTLYFNLD
jgi:hypothetical protein